MEDEINYIPKRNYMSIHNATAASMSFEVSNVAAAAIVSGFLKDLIDGGYLNSNMSYLAVDPSKMRRSRYFVMKNVNQADITKAMDEDIIGISYDGRKEDT